MKRTKYKVFKRQKDLIKFACAGAMSRYDAKSKSFAKKVKEAIEKRKKKDWLAMIQNKLRREFHGKTMG